MKRLFIGKVKRLQRVCGAKLIKFPTLVNTLKIKLLQKNHPQKVKLFKAGFYAFIPYYF